MARDDIQLIDRPELKSISRQVTEWSVTAIMWLLWSYLFLPLLNLIPWVLGIHFFYTEVVEKLSPEAYYMIFLRLLLLIFIVLFIIIAWGYYNYLVFGQQELRRTAAVASREDLARCFRLSSRTVASLQNSKEIRWSGPVQARNSCEAGTTRENERTGDSS